MKLGDATLYVRISEMGTYTINLTANDVHAPYYGDRTRQMTFELPTGPRPVLVDLATILRMVAEELSR